MSSRLWHKVRRGSPGQRLFAAYLAVVLVVAIVGPGLAVYASDEVVETAEESVPDTQTPSAEEAAAAVLPEPVDEAVVPSVEPAEASVPTPEVFPAVAVASAVTPVLSGDDNPALTAGGIRLDAPSSGTYTAANAEKIMQPVPADFTITLDVYETVDGWFMSFTSNYPIAKVVMKGGSAGAYVYSYDPAVMGDTALHCPANPNGKWAGLSHVDFYFGTTPDPDPGDLTVYKYLDSNLNGEHDQGEDMLEGWAFTLYDANNAEVDAGTTDADGSLVFEELEPGTYHATETLKEGWQNTTPLTQYVTVTEGGDHELWFGNYDGIDDPELGSLTVYKFQDNNRNGEHDDGEPMLANWEFTAYQSTPPLAASAIWVVGTGTTDADGKLTFSELLPGEYQVTETLLPGWENTTPLTQTAEVEADEDAELWFGNVPESQEPETGTLVVHKFRDDNENGLFEANLGEVMLEGWTFTLYDSEGELDSGMTDDDGMLHFGNLAAGEYTVTETLLSGWINTTPLTQAADVVAGETKHLWFGNVPEAEEPETGTLVIHKYEDENENKIHDVGEAMLADWQFTVINPAGPVEPSVQAAVALIGSGSTDSSGELVFTGLNPGTVRITETLKPGWTNTTDLTQDATIVAGETTHVWFGNVEEFLPFTELDLTITKVADDHTVDEGQLVTYTLTWWNLMSDEDAVDYTIVDDYDERYLTIVDAAGGTVSGGKITWTFPGPLSKAMGPQTLKYTARVSSDMPERVTNIDNVVVIDDDRDFNLTNNRDDERVVYRPDDPFLPFTGSEYLLLVAAAMITGVAGLLLRRPQAS